MAIISDTNFGSYDHPEKDRTVCTRSRSVVFDGEAGGPTLPRNCPVAYNTSLNLWVPWTKAGSNDTATIRGFVWPADITLDASDEVIGTILVEGTLNVGDCTTDEIIAACNGSAVTRGDIEGAIQSNDPSLRSLGIFIEGLDEVL